VTLDLAQNRDIVDLMCAIGNKKHISISCWIIVAGRLRDILRDIEKEDIKKVL